MSGHLFILSGPSGCGKTTLLNNLSRADFSFEYKITKAPKYAIRERRDENDDIIQLFDENNRPSISLGTVPMFNKDGKRVDLGENGIDIAYAINKGRYGISTSQIKEEIDLGKNVFIILSDFRIIRRLKNIFKGRSSAIYIASAVDTKKLEAEQTKRLGIPEERKNDLKSQFNQLNSASRLQLWDRVAECIGDLNEYWKKFKPGSDSTDIRAEKIRAFHTRYIDNITLFDHVILNYTEGSPEEMTLQALNIIKGKNSDQSQIKATYHPPIFIVAAASGSGKGTMMEMLSLIGSDRVSITSKIAQRDLKDNDKQDGMLAIGKPGLPPKEWPEWPSWWSKRMVNAALKGEIPPEYDLTWEFHGKTTRYGVSKSEISNNIKTGAPQIFVSNIGQFNRFKKLYGDRVVFLYLYRLVSMEEMKKWHKSLHDDPSVAEARTKEISDVHINYMKNIHEFDHVLLNTTRPEDLYDQIFQLLEYYHENKGAI